MPNHSKLLSRHVTASAMQVVIAKLLLPVFRFGLCSALAAGALVVLAACGGSGSSSPAPSNPIAPSLNFKVGSLNQGSGPGFVAQGSTVSITATCTPATDLCAVDFQTQQNQQAQGTGTAQWNFAVPASQAVGSYNVYAHDLTNGQTEQGTLTVNAPPTISVNPSSPVTGQAVTITATCPAADTCEVDSSSGAQLAKSVGTATYTTSFPAPGQQTYSAKDDSDNASVSTTFTVTQGPPPVQVTDSYFAAGEVGNGGVSLLMMVEDADNPVFPNYNPSSYIISQATIPGPSWVFGMSTSDGASSSIQVVTVPNIAISSTVSVGIVPGLLAATSATNVCFATPGAVSGQDSVGIINQNGVGPYLQIPGVNSVVLTPDGTKCVVLTSTNTLAVDMSNGTVTNTINVPGTYGAFDPNGNLFISTQDGEVITDTNLHQLGSVNFGNGLTAFSGNTVFMDGNAFTTVQSNSVGQSSYLFVVKDSGTYNVVQSTPFGTNNSTVASSLVADSANDAIYGMNIQSGNVYQFGISTIKSNGATYDISNPVMIQDVQQGGVPEGLNQLLLGEAIAADGTVTTYVYTEGGASVNGNGGMSIFELNPQTQQWIDLIAGDPVVVNGVTYTPMSIAEVTTQQQQAQQQQIVRREGH